MYSKEERETIIIGNDEDGFWDIYTRQAKIINKLQKLSISPYKTEMEDGIVIAAYYKLNLNQLGFRKQIALTDEQRQKRRENMMKNRTKLSE